MALYDVFLPAFEGMESLNQTAIVGGLTNPPINGVLLQGVNASGVANALAVLAAGGVNYNFDQQTHVYLQSNDNLD